MPKRNKVNFDDPLLKSLFEDPTRSPNQLADELRINRQKLWRDKKRMEEEGIIWGYTAVVDETKVGGVTYLILFKSKLIDREVIEVAIKRIKDERYREQAVRVINVLYVNGEYDILLMFSAPDALTARRYYEEMAKTFGKFTQGKPVLMEVGFPILREGKPNPEIERFRDIIPDID